MVLPGDGLIQLTTEGLYCPAADAWIDPWRPVSRALITHGHADHARPGCGAYWAVAAGEGVLRQRLGAGISLTGMGYGEERRLGGARVSFHSAGHVLGSAQIRISAGGETWLISGDYKRDADPSCAPFEPVTADVLITEATFGLPIYRWRPGRQVAAEILAWWREAPQRPSLLFAYAFGKAQRLLAELAALGVEEEVLLHGAVQALMAPYRSAGVVLPPTRTLGELHRRESLAGRLVIAPPSAHRSPWMKRFVSPQTAFVSGWMAVRGARRRRGFERGFALSDHADWDGLLRTVADSGARQVYVTHGNSEGLARFLREEQGLAAEPLGRAFEGQRNEQGEVEAAAMAPEGVPVGPSP
ncbi:ligase-associated DNA damage response exonuclease [Cyanobium sp. N5-Cardenillas]|uniref:ligase-associated DNA damage response exonuclease n=1 Tax=Cyanobium sp. N5-Cardenillas TaxID=2823720 RepID=UPI0020CBCB75|nr:ligase-associated DNA damage response exonuclease [Cyanobium sp. N5-Cardenillas]MCP9785659.1 ligase-associated DNA damage response exonuclease [Cyanobium sp. N5-Cardenillas]